jgi:hypothetical protein
MAGKSQPELIREMQLELTRLAERFENLREQVSKAELVRMSERIAVLESQLSELKKRDDLFDSRRFQVLVLFIGSLLTLGVQVAVLFLKK